MTKTMAKKTKTLKSYVKAATRAVKKTAHDIETSAPARAGKKVTKAVAKSLEPGGFIARLGEGVAEGVVAFVGGPPPEGHKNGATPAKKAAKAVKAAVKSPRAAAKKVKATAKKVAGTAKAKARKVAGAVKAKARKVSKAGTPKKPAAKK